MSSANFKPKRTAAASRCFLATARLFLLDIDHYFGEDGQGYGVSFLLRDARSEKLGIGIISRPSVCPSVCNVEVPWAYRLD